MNDQFVTILAAVITFLSPIGIAFLKNESWTTLLKIAAPIFFSLAVAIGYCLITSRWNPEDIVQSVLVVFGFQQLAYATILRKVTTRLEAEGVQPQGRHEAVER